MKTGKIVWGIVLVAAGLIFALNALDITDINVFFDGWWTLFIIVPCAIGVITSKKKTDDLIGLLVGVFLLLCCQDVLSFGLFWKLLLPVIIVIVGLKLLFSGIRGQSARKDFEQNAPKQASSTVGCATFSGENLNFDGTVFDGAELTATFGGIKCDLRKAVIPNDCTVTVSAIFGGITILLPENVNVKVNASGVFGGVSDKTVSDPENTVTVFISGSFAFGGVSVK